MNDALTFHVVYDHPRDYPGYWVVRKWTLDGPILPCGLFLTLEDARRSLPLGLFNLGRTEQDDPNIFETWI